jgi:hypothetical protein
MTPTPASLLLEISEGPEIAVDFLKSVPGSGWCKQLALFERTPQLIKAFAIEDDNE